MYRNVFISISYYLMKRNHKGRGIIIIRNHVAYRNYKHLKYHGQYCIPAEEDNWKGILDEYLIMQTVCFTIYYQRSVVECRGCRWWMQARPLIEQKWHIPEEYPIKCAYSWMKYASLSSPLRPSVTCVKLRHYRENRNGNEWWKLLNFSHDLHILPIQAAFPYVTKYSHFIEIHALHRIMSLKVLKLIFINIIIQHQLVCSTTEISNTNFNYSTHVCSCWTIDWTHIISCMKMDLDESAWTKL